LKKVVDHTISSKVQKSRISNKVKVTIKVFFERE